jgi:hypothetical protein
VPSVLVLYSPIPLVVLVVSTGRAQLSKKHD